MNVTRLISELKSRPALWNLCDERIKDAELRKHMWQDVANIMGSNVKTCQETWLNLRMMYSAKLCKCRRLGIDIFAPNASAQSAEGNADGWPYFELMHFMVESKKNLPNGVPDICRCGDFETCICDMLFVCDTDLAFLTTFQSFVERVGDLAKDLLNSAAANQNPPNM